VIIEETKIPGTFAVTPQQHSDERGVFLEWFRSDRFIEMTGHPFTIAQANCSVSAVGTLRGVHFAQVPPGQAKYVSCAAGTVLDVVVDLRVGSPSYGQWDSVLLESAERKAVYIAEGLGHAFVALTDGAVVNYLCSAPYAPGREHGVHPFDHALGITWPTTDQDGNPITLRLSPKDEAAPTLAEIEAQGLLPTYADSLAYVASLRGEG
jgi:dTDP-4-dehydrorhamnose 3,5-epimerase